MKKEQVQIGSAYVAKVSGQLARVRIDAESRFGGWDAINVATKRKVRIKSAQRLRRRVDENDPANGEHAAYNVVVKTGDDDAGPEYDPDKCGTEDCNGIPALTHLGKPLCQTCWERHCGEEQPSEAVETSGDACRPYEEPETQDQENAMSKKMSNKKQTKAQPAATRAKRHKAVPLSAAALADSPVAQANAKSWEAATPRGQRGGTAKAAKKAKPIGEKKPKRVSALDAAATVLRGRTNPMNSKDLITAMDEKGLWKSPGGKTPHATLYAAILREITEKKGEARFKKVERGLFAANA